MLFEFYGAFGLVLLNPHPSGMYPCSKNRMSCTPCPLCVMHLATSSTNAEVDGLNIRETIVFHFLPFPAAAASSSASNPSISRSPSQVLTLSMILSSSSPPSITSSRL